MTQAEQQLARPGRPVSIPLQGGLQPSFAIGLGLVVAIEGVVLHLWIASRSQAWAWAIAALNVATLYWLWREHRAGTRARMLVGPQDVEVDAGSRSRCRFPRSRIASVEAATWRSVPDDMVPEWVNTAKPLEPNVIITLREPVNARLALGITKRVRRIGVRVEPAGALLEALPLHGKADADD